MDDEMKDVLDTFAAECAEHIQKATDYILLLEGQRDEEALNGLFRAFHTIKGNALMLGFTRVGELAHSAENLMARLRNGSIVPSKQAIDLLLASLDSIGMLIAEQLEGTAEPLRIEELLLALEAVSAGTESPQNARLKMEAREKVKPLSAAPTAAPTAPLAAAPKHQAEAAQKPQTEAVPRRDLSILVVEDDFLSRRTLVAMLKPFGTCDIANNGQEAVEAFAGALEEKPYDLVCMDIMMPQMDGFEAVRQIRSAEMLAAIRKLKERDSKPRRFDRSDAVILMTSALDDPDSYINACYRCGANSYLVKPIMKDSLLAAIDRYGLN
ncbi:MAG TPA: hypothetical protein DIC34_04300 [Treponema sp.]|nr:hypothetical protein [Treponema sp.]